MLAAMRVHAVPHAGAVNELYLADWRAVVIDVVRASSTIAQAIASGAASVIPVSTVDEALALRGELVGDDVLLAGERSGLPLPGFDMGNSPAQFTAEAVAGKRVIFTTTNGTAAILGVAAARECIIGSFLNMLAVVEHLAGQGDDVVLVPVGRDGGPVLDDQACAGLFVDKLAHRVPGCQVTDGARQVRKAYRQYRWRILDALRDSASGQALVEIGLGNDLEHCARLGLLDVVPVYVDGAVRAR
ncbi:MAG: 2-phosphosulfolactate phosphatase [Chloroflexi bacterium]|nr:2-phosphosulfolactate phosphatase [Chloroflexota bacterium]